MDTGLNILSSLYLSRTLAVTKDVEKTLGPMSSGRDEKDGGQSYLKGGQPPNLSFAMAPGISKPEVLWKVVWCLILPNPQFPVGKKGCLCPGAQVLAISLVSVSKETSQISLGVSGH